MLNNYEHHLAYGFIISLFMGILAIYNPNIGYLALTMGFTTMGAVALAKYRDSAMNNPIKQQLTKTELEAEYQKQLIIIQNQFRQKALSLSLPSIDFNSTPTKLLTKD